MSLRANMCPLLVSICLLEVDGFDHYARFLSCNIIY